MNVDLQSETFSLLTMSFDRDFEFCKLLCATMDDMVSPDIKHVLAVPSSDIALFSPLKNARRDIIAQEELLPRWLKKVSPPENWLTSQLKLTRRNLYLSYRGLPVRGWIAQQLMKLSAVDHVGTESIMHVDSDVAFIRPFDRSHFFIDGKTPLLRFPGDAAIPVLRPYHRFAGKALGLPERDYFGSGFIGNCVCWRRSVVKAMMAHISDVASQDAFVFLSRTQQFSEYMLYGVFCEFVLGIDASGHFATDRQFCKTLFGLEGADTADRKFQELGGEVAIGIQSTIPLPIERRYALVDQLRRKLAA